MKRSILGSIAAAAIAVAPLAAQDNLFSKLDKNGDGVVKADEVGEDAKGLFERALRRGDKNDDKELTKDEFAASQQESDAPRRPLGAGGAPGRPGGGQFNPREVFARLDTNKDGKIGKDEAQGFVRENFERLDANSDGAIGEDEIARGPGRRPDGAPGAGERPGPEQLAAMFDRMDTNKDGKLTKEEIPEGQRAMVERMLEATGADSIGKDQFLRFMAQRGGRGGDARPGAARPDERRPGQPGPGGFPGRPPVIATLDADSDGELSASEIEAASKALLKLDRNSDGKLTREELFPGAPDGPPRDRPGADRPDERRPGEGRGGLRGRPNPEDFQARLKEADANGDGKLTKDEAPPMLRERFDRIDANSDGVLDETEIRQMFQRLREGGDRPAGQGEGRRGRRPDADRPDAPPRN